MTTQSPWVVIWVLAISTAAWAQYPPASQVRKDGTAIVLEDYASLPPSSPTHGGATSNEVNYKGQLGRVIFLRSEPANAPRAASRFFVVDQNYIVYLLDKASRNFAPLLRFSEIFPNFDSEGRSTHGIVAVAFDPEYAKNGRFYTAHTEKRSDRPTAPRPGSLGKLDLRGYQVTSAVRPPVGPLNYESVLVEWTDNDVKDSTFQGSVREILRVGYEVAHPMADLLFNPVARRGDKDYGNLYVSVGDGKDFQPGPAYLIPQRLDAMGGKILRITPDRTLRPSDMLSANGQYRIPSTGPDPNPFLSVKGALPEIFAYGFRNPFRMDWDAPSNAFMVTDIGERSWEEINVVKKGGNYGYAERDGHEQFFLDRERYTGSRLQPPVPFPSRDVLKVEGLEEPVVPLYPAAVYSHREGDSIANGFVYRGTLMRQLRGKYIFSDMTTGRIFYTDLVEMLNTNGVRNRLADVHELQVLYRDPTQRSGQPRPRRMFDIVAEAFARRGGIRGDTVLPGSSQSTTGFTDPEHKHPAADPDGVPYGGGRADVRLTMGADGELYIISKSDGMIRKLVSARTY